MEEFGPLRYLHGLAWREIGEGTPLVLLHGGSGSRTHWKRNVPSLAGRFRVVTVDLPGFGESAAPPVDMPTSAYVRWFADALRARVGAEPFHLAAFSFGGALGCAALTMDRFSLRGLTLVAPAGYGMPQSRRLGLEKMPDGADDDASRAVVARNLGRLMLAVQPVPGAEAVDLQLRNLAATRYDSRRISLGETLLDDLRSIDAPLQLVWGEQDRLPWPSLDARVARTIDARPDARVVRVPGAGHWVPYEASDAVDRALATFHAERH